MSINGVSKASIYTRRPPLPSPSAPTTRQRCDERRNDRAGMKGKSQNSERPSVVYSDSPDAGSIPDRAAPWPGRRCSHSASERRVCAASATRRWRPAPETRPTEEDSVAYWRTHRVVCGRIVQPSEIDPNPRLHGSSIYSGQPFVGFGDTLTHTNILCNPRLRSSLNGRDCTAAGGADAHRIDRQLCDSHRCSEQIKRESSSSSMNRPVKYVRILLLKKQGAHYVKWNWNKLKQNSFIQFHFTCAPCFIHGLTAP